jgi:histidinol-phosphate aminotransferase
MLTVNTKFKEKGEYKIASCGDSVINLAIVENFNPHQFHGADGINFYPSQNQQFMDLIDEVANYVGVSAMNILVTNGSGKALDMILNAYTTQDTRILIPVPNYPGFVHSADLSQGTVKTIPFYGYQEDYDLFVEEVANADVIYMSVPNLPWGYVFDEDILNTLINKYPKKLFIIDEAYHEYSGVKSFVDKINENNVIVTRTFSKAFALAGARIGYIVSCPDILNILRVGYNAKDILNSSVEYALKTIKNRKYYLTNVDNDMKMMDYIKERMCKIVGFFKFVYEFIIPKGPWFIVKARDPALLCKRLLLGGYLVRDKSSELKDCIRISLCAKNDIIEVIDIIEAVNNEMCYTKTVIFDLDGTLRKDYDTDVFPCVHNHWKALTERYSVKIVTNNPKPKSSLMAYLTSNKLDLDDADLVCPITREMNPKNDTWFEYNGKIYVLGFPVIDHALLQKIVVSGEVCIIEKEYNTSSGEMGQYPDIKLPHIGYFLEFISKCYPDIVITIIGKESLLMNIGMAVMVGDTDIDKRFAESNGFLFVDIRDVSIDECIDQLLI